MIGRDGGRVFALAIYGELKTIPTSLHESQNNGILLFCKILL